MQAAGPASIGLQAATSIFQGFSQANQLNSAAANDRENARLSLLQGALNEEDLRRRGRAVQGEAISALAEGGTGVEGGSARDLIYQNSLEIEYAAMGARYTAANEARGYTFRAQQEKSSATNAIIGGFLGAGAAAVSGISKQAQFQQLQNAYFPGGQQLPLPPPSAGYSPPPYRANGGF